ncbi:alpha/beta hydrolase [Saccharothrix sp. 6-C]|nr:alpha/beta hydrolase [Saccharothrix sp. 6-C]
MWAGTLTGHPVLTPDLYRLGTGEPSLDTVVDGLARLLDDRGEDRAVLVGCSFGGYAAMAFLRRHPDRVRGLGLIGTRAAADTDEERARRLGFAERVTDPALGPALVDATAPLLLGAGTRRRRPDLRGRVDEMVRSIAPADVAWAQRAIAARTASFDVLAAYTGPAVVLAGAEDALVPLDDARAMAATLPRGALEVVPDAGHLLPLEAPEVVDKALASLLDQREDS